MVEALLGRRKAKRDFEYEVKWWGMPSDPKHNKWIMKAECAPCFLVSLKWLGCCRAEVPELAIAGAAQQFHT